jgi:hypothetical protein
MTLNQTIHALTERLARELSERMTRELLTALKGASLDDISALVGTGHARRGPGRPPKTEHGAQAAQSGAPKTRRGKRLQRRSAADIDKLAARIVDLVARHKKTGIRGGAHQTEARD